MKLGILFILGLIFLLGGLAGMIVTENTLSRVPQMQGFAALEQAAPIIPKSNIVQQMKNFYEKKD